MSCHCIGQVSLHAPGAGGSSFLPQWLAFPLGFSAGQKLSLSQPDLQASQALSRTAGALPNTLPQELPARPVLQRRSLDGPPAASSLATPPLARSRSEVTSPARAPLLLTFHLLGHSSPLQGSAPYPVSCPWLPAWTKGIFVRTF